MEEISRGRGKKAVAQTETMATVEADGAIRWTKNGRYLMDDFCEKLEYAGDGFSREAAAKKRKVQDAESIAEYRKGMDRKELEEARAAFGKGVTIVDVLTGERMVLRCCWWCRFDSALPQQTQQ